MIKLHEALKTKIIPEDLKDIIESDNTERKFILGIQIIFSTDKEQIGWNLLNSLNLKDIVDENFIVNLLVCPKLKLSELSSSQLTKFINFIIRVHSENSNMAIQKHLANYTPEKPQDSENLNIDKILQLIAVCEQHKIPPARRADICQFMIKEMSKIPLPREANDIKLFKAHYDTIRDFFEKLQLENEERLSLLEFIYSNLTNAMQTPTPLMGMGLLLIPSAMITQAVEFFFKTLEWKGKKTQESVVTSIGVLIYWLRTSNIPVPLDLWIVKTLSVLNTNGLNEIIEDVARKNVTQATLSLLVPVFQSKMLPVLQALFEYSRNTQELFNMIEPRIMKLLTFLESTKSDIYTPVVEFICDTLGSFDYTEDRYEELIKYLASRNRSPSKVIAKKLIGPLNLNILRDNPRVGLLNLGNTCYLNSVVQALFMTKQFCREILTTQRSDRTVVALQKLFALMLFSPRPEQNPSSVVNLIRPDDFLPGIQHDSSEFLGSVLDRLHEFEKKNIKDDEDWDDTTTNNSASNDCKPNVQEVPMEIDVENIKQDVDEPKDKIVDNTSNLCQTYVQKIFGGKICTRYLCSTCNGNSVNVDSFRDLQLSFPEKSENENCDVQYNVQQLLEFYFSTEELTLVGDNQYHCDNCKILCNGMRCTEILEPPRNLILTLKHFRYDSRHHIRSKLLYKVFHDEVISVNVKGSFNANSTRNVDYKLYAAIIHSGTSLDSGHYYTIARESDNKWFKFNDSYVSTSSLEELRSLISPNTPYILFYQRLSTASATVVHPETTHAASSSVLTNHINDHQNFPNFHELPSFLRDLIDEDKLNFETESLHQQNNKMTYNRFPMRDNFDDNDPGNQGSYNIDSSYAPNRFIY